MEIDPVATRSRFCNDARYDAGRFALRFSFLSSILAFPLSSRDFWRQPIVFYETNNPETYSALSVDRCVANNSYRSLRRAWRAQPKFELAKFCGAPGENRRANAKEHQGAHWPA